LSTYLNLMRTMIILALFAAVFGCTGSITQSNAIKNDPVDSLNFEIPADAAREKFADNPSLEKITIKNKQGYVTLEGNLLNGKKEGTWAEYNPNGTVKSLTVYSGGKKEGLYIELNGTGQFVRRISYHNNVRHGEYVEFAFPNKKEERNYVNGKIEGVVRLYYPDGKVMEEGAYKNDTRDGISRWYGVDGKLSIEYEYKNGVLVQK